MGSTKYNGAFTKRINVTTNDPDNQKVTLTCEGRVLLPLDLSPGRVNFGKLSFESPPQQQTVSIYAGDAGEIAPELLPARREAKVNAELCEIEPGQHYELQISAGPPWTGGRLREVVQLKTGVAEAPQMSIFVSGIVDSVIPPERRITAQPRSKPPKPQRSPKKPTPATSDKGTCGSCGG